jgi:hypothetical protein
MLGVENIGSSKFFGTTTRGYSHLRRVILTDFGDSTSTGTSPIEHLWNYLKRKLNEHEIPPKSLHELWERVEKEWEAIPNSFVQDMIVSMPRRCTAVVQAKGGHC